MSTLIDRYLDGDLGDEEARAFLDAVAGDPRLEAELRSYEAMLAMAASAVSGGPSAQLTDRVMDRVYSATRRSAPAKRPARAWTMRAAWAAGLVAVFGLGYVSARVGTGPAADLAPTAVETASRPVAESGGRIADSASGPGELRLVRLVYAPENPAVTDVAIAGSFNAWNPRAVLMQRRGNVFVAQMVLPPDTYEYMFVVNGEDWVTDPLAQQTRDDGFGRENAVLDLTL